MTAKTGGSTSFHPLSAERWPKEYTISPLKNTTQCICLMNNFLWVVLVFICSHNETHLKFVGAFLGALRVPYSLRETLKLKVMIIKKSPSPKQKKCRNCPEQFGARRRGSAPLKGERLVHLLIIFGTFAAKRVGSTRSLSFNDRITTCRQHTRERKSWPAGRWHCQNVKQRGTRPHALPPGRYVRE